MITTESQGLSYIQYRADGVESDFVLVFPYLYQANIFVYVDGVATTAFTWLNASEIQMDVVPSNGQLLTIKRITQRTARLVDFTDGGVIRERNLDLDSDQIFYLAQEAIDLAQFALIINNVNDTIDAQGNRIINVADGYEATDAVNKQQLDALQVIADAAADDAAEALATANGIAATANTALANSAAAVITANAAAADAAAAVVTANGIAATAAAALVAADAAVVTADAAAIDASAALAAVVSAQADATLALANAAIAQAAADAAQATADAAAAAVIVAQAAADAAQGEVDALELVVTANDTANNKNLFTGLISGGTVTINVDPTKFDVAAGTGIVVDSWTDPLNVTKTLVSWSAFTAVPATYLATNTESYISINSAGAIVQSAVEPSPLSRRQGISLVKLAHTGNTTINNVTPSYNINHAHFSQFRDFVSYLNYINEGNWITPNGANLSINKSVGSMLGLGINDNDQTNPNIKSFGSQVGATFQYRTRTGVATGNLTSIVPASYDVGGVVTAISGSNNQATNQRIYLTASGLIRIQYGQTVYSTLAAAIEGLRTETFVEFSNLTSSGALIGILSVTKGATNLSITSTAKFINPSRFGEVSAGASGISVSTLQQAYDNSATPEIVTDTTRGAMTVKRGSAADTDDVIEVLDGAGVTVASITGEGNSVLMGVKNPRVLETKRDTYANLVTYAALGTSVNGQFVFSTDTKKMYHIVDNVLTELGGGGAGVGGVDILFVQDFESATLGEFTQTGLSLSVSNPLKGTVSALMTHQLAINQSFKQVKAVAEKFRGRSHILGLDIKSGASAGNVTINIYDETNAANIVASEQLTLSNATGGIKSSVVFTIPETCTSFSYTITALPEAGSPVTRIDDILCQLNNASLLETSVTVPNITAWQGYTPTFTGFGTATNIEFEWRQVGENVEIRGKFTTGTPTSVEARVSLPNAYTSSSSSLIASLASNGTYFRGVSTSSHGGSVLMEPSVAYITLGPATTFNSVTSIALSKALGTDIAGVSDIISLTASVPVLGLTATSDVAIPLTQSGIVQEADSMIRLDTHAGYGSTATMIPRFTNISENIGSDILYQDSATNGASFTILTNGVYSFSFSKAGGTSTDSINGISKNASGADLTTSILSLTTSKVLNRTYIGAITGTSAAPTSQWTGYLVAGDVIRPHTDSGTPVAVARSHFTASKQGSLKQVTVNTNSKITIPTSELRFEGASARGAVATAIVKFNTMAKIRGDAFTVTNTTNDGTYVTMTKAGKLNISVTLLKTSASTVTVITKNQTVLTTSPSDSSALTTMSDTSANLNAMSSSWSGDVVIGDVIRVSSGQVPSAYGGNNLGLTFQEQDIQVSVSNTLPQFSESDTILRAAGNGGQVITANVTDIPFVAATDTAGGWNGSQYTIKESGVYSIDGGVIYTTNTTGRFQALYVNGTLNQSLNIRNGLTQDIGKFQTERYFSVGEVLSIRELGVTSTLVNNGTFHYLNITKVGKPNVTGVDVTPFVNVPQPEKQASTINQVASFTAATITGALSTSVGTGLYSYNSTTGIYTALKTLNVTISASFKNTGASTSSADVFANGTVLAVGNGPNTASVWVTATGSAIVPTGSTFYVGNSGAASNQQIISVSAEALSDQILTAPETFSTDTAALTYAGSGTYTLSTLANAPVGTFITYTYAASTNTRTQTTVAPTQTTADMNANGMLIYTRAYNAASTAALPAVFAIQIGKGLKGVSKNLYKSTSKINSGELDYAVASTTAEIGATLQDYNESTGILLVDAGWNLSATTTSRNFIFSDITSQSSGYLVINASKNPALVGVGIDRVAARGINTAGTSIANSTAVTLVYDTTKTYDTNGALNTATGIFTAPETGYYNIDSVIQYTGLSWTLGQFLSLSIMKNGTAVKSSIVVAATTGQNYGVSVSDVIFLGKNETASIVLFHNRGAASALNTAAGSVVTSFNKISGIN